MTDEFRTLATSATHIINCIAGLRICQEKSENGFAKDAYQDVIYKLQDGILSLSDLEKTLMKGKKR